jgi:hypothetical protein
MLSGILFHINWNKVPHKLEQCSQSVGKK